MKKNNAAISAEKKVLVSACLYGYCTKYNGSSNLFKDKLFLEWKNRGMLIPFCPEVAGGLSTPREPSEICKGCVLSKSGKDVTAEFEKGAAEALKAANENQVIFAILKDGSPSCGSTYIYDGTFSGKKISGSGVCTKLLLENGVVVLPESDMATAKILMNEN